MILRYWHGKESKKVKVRKKLSPDNMSELKTKEVDISVSVIAISECLHALYNRFPEMPCELEDKIKDLLFWIDDKYYEMPKAKHDVELFDEDYKLIYSYKELLS